MSSNTSSLPAWKQALLDRKRHQENGGPSLGARPDSTRAGIGSGLNTTPNTVEATPATGSPWKQTTLSKKLQQYATPSSPTSTTEKETTGNRADSTLHHTSVVTEIQVESADDPHTEERLLPIKQNPILLSDRQKRRLSKANHARQEKRASRKSDPRATLSTKSAGSDEGMPSVSDGSSTTPDTSPAILTEDVGDEVFEEEVTYGKGFVHKLLKKFITLTGKEEPTPTVAPTKTQGSVRDAPKGSSRNSSRTSGSEKDSTEKRSSRLTVNSEIESSRRSWDDSALCSTETAATGDKTSKDLRSGVEVHPRSSDDLEPLTSQLNVVDDAEDLPHNIVSAARGIFEHNTSGSNSISSMRKKFTAPEKPTTDRTGLKRSAPEKPTVEASIPDRSSVELPATSRQTVDRTADVSPSLKRRPAPERSGGEKIASGSNFNSWESTLQNLASSKDREDSESHTPAISSEPVVRPLQNAPYGRMSYPAGAVGTRNQPTPNKESNRDLLQSKQTGSLTFPSVDGDKVENVAGTSVGASAKVEASVEEKPMSVRAASKLYEARNEKTQTSRVLDVQNFDQKVTKNTTRLDSHANKNTDSVSLSGPFVGTGTGLKEETKPMPAPATTVSETRVRVIDRNKPDNSDTMTRSDSNVTVTIPNSTATPSSVRVDASVDATNNVQPSQTPSVQQQQQKDNKVQTHDLTTRVRVGSYANASEQQKPSAVENIPTIERPASNSVPSTSSIRTENQVTVIQIGSTAPHVKPPGKLENVEAKPGLIKNNAGKVVNTGRLQNEYTDIPVIGKNPVYVKVGNESDRIDMKTETQDYNNAVSGNNRNDSSRYEPRNDIRNDALRNDTTTRNMTNSTKSETARRKADDGGVSRPGKLLIRPASNLVASKTKTEYLTMTKYNDIKKGEFAPAKRPIDFEDMTNGDVVDEGGFEVVGGGISVGKSLLAKTKRGKVRWSKISSHVSFV